MKLKSLVALSLISTLLPLIGFAYQNQGFDSYTENGGTISFSCSNQCVIILGEKGANNLMKINGLKGDGTVIAGVMGTDQFYPIANKPANQDPSFYISSLNGQTIPANAPVGIVIQGKVFATSANISFVPAKVVDKIGQGRTEYWSNEGQTFYGINLRYGQKINGTSVVTIAYWIFVLSLIALYFKGKLSMKHTVMVGIGLFLILALRNQIDYTKTTIAGLNSYTFAAPSAKAYGNLGDFYEFINRARETMKIDETQKACKTFTKCGQEWPFCVHMDTVFMKPCENTKVAAESDYQIYYKMTPTAPAGTKVLDFNGSSVYKTK